jgi:metal-responsive CopG/Arc/MetJ family transcriptional regulator
MHTLSQLQKQQVGLRLPKYLIDEIDDLTKIYSLNRTDIILEAVKSYLSEQKAKIFYDEFEASSQELVEIVKYENTSLTTLNTLIDELEDN